MAWAYQVNVVAASLLQPHHHPGKGRRLQIDSLVLLAYLVVLAEDAGQVASGEEYGARSVLAHQGRLFPIMWPGAAHPGQAADATKSPIPGQPVNLAAAWTDPALSELLHRFIGKGLEVLP